jgi:hypothetical protein
MLKKILYSTLWLWISGVTLSSCKKEVPAPAKPSGKQVFQNTTKIVTHTKFLADGILAKYGIKSFAHRVPNFLLNTCATLIVDTSGSPHIAILDYGTGCTESNGTFYAGKLTITYPDADVDLNNPDTHIQIDFDNYVVDSMLTNGTLTFNNLGYNTNGNLHGNLTFNFTITNTLNNFTVNGALTQQFQKLPGGEIEFTGGLNAADPATGKQYTQTVTDPLWMGTQPGCNGVFIKGVVKIEETGQSDVFIHYGQGECDNIAVEIKDGIRKIIAAGEEED